MTRRDEPIRPMTLGNMRQNGVRGLFVTCQHCGHHSRPRIESGILIHRTGDSDSIIAEFLWPGRSSGTFATISATTGLKQVAPARGSLREWFDKSAGALDSAATKLGRLAGPGC